MKLADDAPETHLDHESRKDPGNFNGHVALVTGAGSGVGRAIAIALLHAGVRTCVAGRNRVALVETVLHARDTAAFAEIEDNSFPIDLTVDASVEDLCRHLQDRFGRLDMLIHSAGLFSSAHMEQARIEDLDSQYRVNVRAPYLLTQALLPLLKAARGQIVFINSSAGQVAKRPDIGQYAATKHALKAVADSLREEVNRKGVRVLSVHLGRTATPMQAAVHRAERKAYHPELLIQPEDVARLVLSILQLPRTAEVTDIHLRPMQASLRPMES